MAKRAFCILDLVERKAVPEPWAEGDNIPWSESGFSGRMLAEHLSQEHDLASRRFEIIDRHTEWQIRQIENVMRQLSPSSRSLG